LKEKNEEAVRDAMHEQIFIELPNYGTRTHTIILVDDKDQVAYYERNLKSPINSENFEWEDNIFEFDLE